MGELESPGPGGLPRPLSGKRSPGQLQEVMNQGLAGCGGSATEDTSKKSR
jgi:hypothetical protein